MSIIHSLSKAGTFERCRRRYQHQYLDKLPRPPRSPSAARGIDIHETVDGFVARRIDGPLASPLDFYQGFLERLRNIAGVRSEAKSAVTREWVHLPGDWDGPEVYARAVYDVIVPPIDGQVEIFDWKTGKIYDDHVDQREFYSCLALAEYPEATRIRASTVYLDSNQTRSEIRFPSDLADARTRWTQRFARVETATEFPPNPQYGCRWCPYSKIAGGPCLF